MTRNARTNPENGLRFYNWQGEEYPSVTTLRRLLGQPHGLVQWQISKVVERAVTRTDELVAILNRPAKPRERVRDKNVVKEAGQWLRKASTDERDSAADRGTRAHEAIENGVRWQDADPDIRGYLAQYANFMSDTGAKVLTQERQVWNLTDGYAGTLDAIIQIGHRLYMTDYKTSKGVHIDYALQLIGYSMGEFIGEDDVVDEEATDLLLACDGMAILHLEPDGWEFVEVKPTSTLFKAFKQSVGLAKFLWENDGQIDNLVARRVAGGALIAPAPAPDPTHPVKAAPTVTATEWIDADAASSAQE